MGEQFVEQGAARRLYYIVFWLLMIGLLIGMLQLLAGDTRVALAQEIGTDGDTGEGDAGGSTTGDTGAGDVDDATDGDTGEGDADSGEAADENADAENEVEPQGVSYLLYLPVIAKSPPVPQISASRPNSSNSWTVSWTVESADGVTGYNLEESQTSDFSSGVNSIPLGATTAQPVTKSPSPFNTYYYRVQAVVGTQVGDWSEVIAVHGAYLDNFSSSNTGWAERRTTFLEETNVYYGSGNEAGYLIAITADRWDWVLGSPLAHAPQIPYALEYRSRVHDPSNLVSGGAVMGGDWNGDACPEVGNVYQTDNCFNHFYNFNFIFYGPLKLLFEQVDSLFFCPNCGGSPLKRLGSTAEIDPLLPNPATNWHTYRMEVRANGIAFFIDGVFKRTFPTTAYVNDPYFGVFASTDEYKPSIWFYDYYAVTPLDN